jgi:O-antigen/teichoic acid export membrane protein
MSARGPGPPPDASPDLPAADAPPPARSLKANFAWTLAANVIYAGCQWLMLMAVAKLGTREMVGQFSYALALTAPVSVLTSLQLRSVQATDASGQFPFSSYLGLRLLGAGLSLAIVAVLAALAPGPGVGPVVLAMGVAKAIEALSDIGYGLLQRHERMDLIARSMIIRGVTAAAAFTAAIAVSGSVTTGVVALCGTWGLALFLYDVPRTSALHGPGRATVWSRPSFAPAALRHLGGRALPLGAMAFLLSLGLNVPRYFIERALGLADLGVFSAVSYVVVALAMVLAALGQAAMPRMAVHHARGRRADFLRLTFLLGGLGVALGLTAAAAAAVAGGPLLALLYRPDYAEAQPVFFWTALASSLGLAGSALGYCLTATGSFRAQAPLAVVVLGTTVASCWLLVPRFGLLGAVAAVAVASVVQLAGHVLLLRAELREGRSEATR